MYRREYSMKTVGRNLKRLRIQHGYSVNQIKEYLRLGSVQAVYKYEEGKSFPQADALLALMELYQVGVKEIVCDIDTIKSGIDYSVTIDSHSNVALETIGNKRTAKFVREYACIA